VREVDELIERILNSSGIPSGKRRGEIQRELRSHIEDFVAAARAAGHEAHAIEKLVLKNFGDPAQIAGGFAWVYRHERRRLRAFAYTLSTMVLASSLLAAILAMQAGVALGFGRPIVQVLASRHTAIEALDILASVAIYLGVTSLENVFGSRQFQKAALLLTAIVSILMVACFAAGLPLTFLCFGLINGIFCRAVQLFITRKLARIAIVAVCFPLAGLISALQWAPASPVVLAATAASWFAMGAGYQLMTHLAARVDAALLNGLERIQAGT